MANHKGALSNHMISWNGKTQSAREWSAEIGHGLSPQAIINRVRRVERGQAGYDIDRAMNPKPLPRGLNGPPMTKAEPVRAEMRDAQHTPYCDDDWAWYVVHSHPEGLTLEQIGDLYGLSRERVRQIEEDAVRKINRQPKRKAEILDMLREVDSLRPSRLGSLSSASEAGYL